MLIVLLGTHIYFTLHLKFPQKKILSAIKFSVMPDPNALQNKFKNNKKSISSFAALSTTLAATLGTGNIVGVSTAIALGGPGAVFWCWLTGILGMATSYAECYLSFLYRIPQPDGGYIGGPMYVLKNGLKRKKLSIFYALCTICAAFGVGCTTQSNAITQTTTALWNISPSIVGITVSILCGFVIIGGIRSIGNICSKLVPIMGAFYIICCLLLLCINHSFLILAIQYIVKNAFCSSAAFGGFIGSSFQLAARYGIARGLFTNEAGLGSAAIASSEADTKNPKRQAFIQMTATFWDTVFMCAITGLVIVSNILKNPSSIQGYSHANLTTAAFQCLPYGDTLLAVSLIAFALATLIGWCFFGERATYFLFGEKGKKQYQTIYLFMIYLGAIMSLDLAWELTDLINACMVIPNIIALFCLRKQIK
ncbi:alanine/glycine:cation symporter family protein [Anaeromicropila populeti]|uniref:Alanine or glycine:cation symporter, AGCS family n=1 Tax=Anaeromicropila populeti TaxID=37658 RepID=A0A1I6K0N1_9FIRM|nr:amino acid carrier protein [Anaeromicropila populeti]SFR84789.1 alanine or glycine:cation symporter, AGCS family [Anaeromicropila populeti]